MERRYTEEEKRFALEVIYANGLRHSYWIDQYGKTRYTDEALGCGPHLIPFDENLERKYKRWSEQTKSKNMYIYIRSEPGLYTVGFYDPSGKWQPESDHANKEEAAKRVHYLNGGKEELEKPVFGYDKKAN